MALLFDLENLSDGQTNSALQLIYKAIHSHDDDGSIWAQHESPYIRRLVELFTERGLMRLADFRAELGRWLSGEKHIPSHIPARPEGAMRRWSREELGIVKLYLESLPPDQWTLDDNMMMVDYLTQRYMPEDDMRTEAEWLSTRSNLMGRVQANMESITPEQADVVLAALPSTVEEAAKEFPMTGLQRNVLEYSRVRSAQHVQNVNDDARRRIKSVVVQHAEQKALGIATGSSLETRLNDTFSILNRDWRRVAVTEAGENANQGYIATMAPGRKVKRVEQYRNVCSWCRKIDGKIFDVVDPAAPDKDGSNQVWVGKTNVGRSASPMKRVDGGMVERGEDEMYWVAAGTQHPNCRGRWVPVVQDEPNDDKDFGDWLRAKLTPAKAD